jgi:CxxC motif-containing protein (DUF1111 family)
MTKKSTQPRAALPWASISRLLKKRQKTVMVLMVLLLPFATIMVTHGRSGASDPGVRQGPAGAGGPISGLNSHETSYFNAGLAAFMEVDSVKGTIPGEAGSGLGPRFNLNSCAGCHAQPEVGGSSPFSNPQVTVATLDGATNSVPFFITPNGPVREARFKFTSTGNRDGGVHNLFTITGRSDASGCSIDQPDFDAAADANNLIFRIPTPVFGGGLIEAIPRSTILANRVAHQSQKEALGIDGHVNTNGNDGTITRFGWKAQNKSLELFASEAYNVEQGVTNEIFQNERDETPGCVFNGIPEDHTNFSATLPTDVPGDVVKFALFLRFLAPPTPAADNPSIVEGRALFNDATRTGCALCHTATLTTGLSSTAALSMKPVHLFSDLLLHHMGPGLADDILQGHARGDEFRTAPLWGLGKRIFFLHDGRTTDLVQAIQAHRSVAGDEDQFPDSEANAVVDKFNALSVIQQQAILHFLRSL